MALFGYSQMSFTFVSLGGLHITIGRPDSDENLDEDVDWWDADPGITTWQDADGSTYFSRKY